jgi:hypothetical protein
MVLLENYPKVSCPTCRGVGPASFDVFKADAYIDQDSVAQPLVPALLVQGNFRIVSAVGHCRFDGFV